MTDHTGKASLIAWIVLILVGVGWGTAQALSKVIVEGGHHPIGIAALSAALGAAVLTIYHVANRRPLPLGRRYVVFYLIAGALGTALPNALTYEALRHLQVGIVSVVMALVPILTLLIALLLRMERPEPVRMTGLGMGAIAVLLLVVPEASLPSPDLAIWVALPVLTAVSYAAESIYIARAQPGGLAPLQVMCGLFWAALVMLLPVAVLSDTWMWSDRIGTPELALVAMTF
ncbi:MAG: DMT family transporter, partial [Pseudomonadota bacterium]